LLLQKKKRPRDLQTQERVMEGEEERAMDEDESQ
jgi:hypothetical protein